MIKATAYLADQKVVELKIKTFTFSGGEVYVKIENINEIDNPIQGVNVYSYVTSSEELVQLMMLTDAIKRSPFYFHNKTGMILELPYIPGARQDRVCESGESLSADVYISMINSMGYERVIVHDPHSDVSPALIKNVQILEQSDIVVEMLGMRIKQLDIALVSPDAGAQKKTMKIAKKLGGIDVIKADKVRDTLTGQISHTEINYNPHDRHVLIVDDILDGGGTFIPLAKQLKQMGATTVDLYITHGIFSKGVDIFDGVIDNIFCKHIWYHNVESRNEKGILRMPQNVKISESGEITKEPITK